MAAARDLLLLWWTRLMRRKVLRSFVVHASSYDRASWQRRTLCSGMQNDAPQLCASCIFVINAFRETPICNRIAPSQWGCTNAKNTSSAASVAAHTRCYSGTDDDASAGEVPFPRWSHSGRTCTIAWRWKAGRDGHAAACTSPSVAAGGTGTA